MQKIQSQLCSKLALSAVAAFATTCWLPVVASAAPEMGGKVNLAQALKQTVLLFPFDVPDTVGNKMDVRELLTDMASSRLLASSKYSVVQFHKTLPPVARLHLDQQLSDSDISEPYAEDNVKATKIAKMVGYDVAFLGTVDEYTYNEADKSVDMVVSGRLLDTKTGKFVSTPVTLKGSSTKGGSGKEADKALEAARNAGQQLMAKVVPIANVVIPPTTTPVVPKSTHANGTRKRRSDSGLLWGILAIGLGLGIGLSSRGHGGSGGGVSDNPPPPP